MTTLNKARVAVGMSGGVDSAVAAMLLLERGFDVVGLTMQIWDGAFNIPEKVRSGCYGPGEEEDIRDAKAVAARLGIEHHTVPLAEEYRREILGYYRSEYLCGRTPNPCVVCNRRIKFGLLLEKAEQSGIRFERFATGHYARISYDETAWQYRLLRGVDLSKDQSYFLFHLSQSQLAGIIFPLGEMMKKEVVKLAVARGFSDIAAKQESQDFIESEDHSPLFSPDEVAPGPIVDTCGKVLGTHRGLVHYTIGQREGLGVAAGRKVYVKGILKETNTVVVAGREEVLRDSCQVKDANWISGSPPAGVLDCEVRIRYRQKAVKASVSPGDGATAQIVFAEPQFAVAPGQAAVFYSGDEVIGGGFIA